MTAAHVHADTALALVSDHDVHRGRLADEGRQRLGNAERAGRQAMQHRSDPDTAHFLVIGQRQMDRLCERCRHHRRHGGEAAGQKTLHVDRAAAIGLAVPHAERERIAGPVLPVHRHHIRVAGEHIARLVLRPDAGEQRGLLPGRVRRPVRSDAMAGEIGFGPVDQREVGMAACGVEPDQCRQNLQRRRHLRRGIRAHGRVLSNRRGQPVLGLA